MSNNFRKYGGINKNARVNKLKTDKIYADNIQANNIVYNGNTFTNIGSNWVTSGDNIFRILGNVGIGTNNPLEKLDVSGNTRIYGELISDSIKLNGDIDMSNNRIINILDPSFNQDAVNKQYVDIEISSINTDLSGINAILPTLAPIQSNINFKSGSVIVNEQLVITAPVSFGGILSPPKIMTTPNYENNATTQNPAGFILGTLNSDNIKITNDETLILKANIQANILDVNGNTRISGELITGLLKLLGNIDMSNNTIINVADPSQVQDATNKKYVDSEIEMLQNEIRDLEARIIALENN